MGQLIRGQQHPPPKHHSRGWGWGSWPSKQENNHPHWPQIHCYLLYPVKSFQKAARSERPRSCPQKAWHLRGIRLTSSWLPWQHLGCCSFLDLECSVLSSKSSGSPGEAAQATLSKAAPSSPHFQLSSFMSHCLSPSQHFYTICNYLICLFIVCLLHWIVSAKRQ